MKPGDLKSHLLQLVLMPAGLLTLTLTVPAAAATFYVAEGGVNSGNNCLDAGNPCATIDRAIALAGTGDLIEVAGGDYTEPLIIDKSLSLHGAGQGLTRIQAHAQKGMADVRTITIAGTPTVAISDVTIRHGVADDDLYGGGLLKQGGELTLSNVTFSDNAASYGGGLYTCGSNSLTLIDVTFSDNGAGVYGGGMHSGSLHNCPSGDPELINVVFDGNQAWRGGGMYNENSSPELINAVFVGNTTNSCGAGMFNDNASPTLTNVTFSGNIGFCGAGMNNSNGSDPVIRNNIFWNNEDDTGVGTARASINNHKSIPVIEFSLVQGCNSAGNWLADCGTDGGGNPVDADPLFIDMPDPGDHPSIEGDLRLQETSPAIDAGNNAFVAGVGTDLEGQPRIIGAAVDLGAYEAGGEIFRDRFEL